jgi:hypothetical protein
LALAYYLTIVDGSPMVSCYKEGRKLFIIFDEIGRLDWVP